MANILSFIIRANNQASGPIRQINEAIAGLSGTITKGIIQAQLLGVALNQVQKAAGYVKGAFAEATSLQLKNIQAATTFSALTGKSYNEAATFIEKLNSRLAESAKALPGATQDYKNLAVAVQDNVLDAFKDLNGNLDLKGFEDTVASIAESYGALAAGGGIDIGNTGLGLTKALGGASRADLQQIQFFEQNQQVLNEIDRRLQMMGKSTLRDLDIKARVKLLEEVGKKYITEDFKREASNSVDGLMQAFKSSLFDPSSGIFGVMKDVDLTVDNTQSVFTSYNEALKELIGSNGIFTSLGKLLEAMGVQFADPMAVLKRGFDYATSGLRIINEALGAAREFFYMGSNFPQVMASLASYFDISPEKLKLGTLNFFRNLSGAINRQIGNLTAFVKKTTQLINFQQVGFAVGSFLSMLFNSALDFVKNIDWRTILAGIATAISAAWETAKGFVAGFASNISFDTFRDVGLSVITAVGSVVSSVAQAISKIDFAGIGNKVSSFLNSFFRSIDLVKISDAITATWEQTTTAFNLAIKGVGAFISQALNRVDFTYVGVQVGAFLGKFLVDVVNFILNLDWLTIEKALLEFWLAVIKAVGGFIIGLSGTVVPGVGEAILKTGVRIVDWISNLWNIILDKIKTSITSLGDGIKNNTLTSVGVDPSVLPSTAGVVEAGVNTAAGVILQNVPIVGPIISAINAARPRYLGQVPAGLGGLIGAAVTEAQNMPPGAGLTIANTSEAIIPRDQVLALAGNSSVGNRNVSVNFAPVFNLQGVNDPRAIAQMALDELDGMLNDYLSSQLA